MLGKALLAMTLIAILWGCISSSQYESKTQEQKGHAPVLVDHYAPKVIRPGTTWKLYLRAQDKDGDMNYVGVLMYQPGVGYHPTSATYIKKEDSEKFAGYVFMATPPDLSLIGDTLELTVVVRDHYENGSKPLNLQLTFDQVVMENVPEKWQFAAEHRLGALNFDITGSAAWGR